MTTKHTLQRLFVLALTLIVWAPAAMSMEKSTLYFWEEVACPNEVVYLEGDVRFQFHETGKGWVYQAFWSGNGWGLESNAEYLIQGKWMEVMNEKRPFVFYWNDHFQMVGKGAAPTYRLYLTVKFDEADDDGFPVPDSIHFEDEEWPCPAIAFDFCESEPCSGL